MEVKQRGHMHPLIVRYWGLEACEAELRQAAEFVNLKSRWRGRNRFPNLLLAFEFFSAMPAVQAAGISLPQLDALRDYCNSGLPLGNPSLKTRLDQTGDPELKRLYEWSLAVNESIDRRMPPVPPFAHACRALRMMRAKSEVIVVSQTPTAALVKEWQLHRLEQYVGLIAGQEEGSKGAILQRQTAGRYRPAEMLMIGDAPGDAAAAREAGMSFYPITPGAEEAAWEHFCDEAYGRFLNGTYVGAYEEELIRAFDVALPADPPWKKS